MNARPTYARQHGIGTARLVGKAGMWGILLFFAMGSIQGEKAILSDPGKLFREMKDRFLRIADYSCEIQAFSSDGKKNKTDFYHLYFKKPKQLRLEVQGGSDDGTVLLFREGGDVRIKQGRGLGSFLPLSFKPSHPWVTNLRGFGLHQTDWGWLIDAHIQFLPFFSMRELKKENLDGRPTKVVELVSRDPSKTMQMAREIVWIDEQWQLPLKYLMYDASGKLIQSMLCWNVEINRSLVETLFTEFDKKT